MDEYFKEQEDLLSKIVESVLRLPDKNRASLLEIQRSIEILNKEAKEANSEDVPGIMDQLNLQHALAEKLSNTNAIPDADSPYFGHMKIDQGGRIKDIFIGHTTFSEHADYRIVDWKNAPIAKVFYQYEEGEDFDIEFDDRVIEGKLVDKSILTIIDKNLLRIDRGGKSFINRDGKWISLAEDIETLKGGEGSSYNEFGTGQSNYQGPDVISLLDKTQYELVNRGSTKPLLIIGGAGSGKTTVALYRLARLIQNREVFPNQALVLVPNSGLVKLSKNLLEKIGIRKVRVFEMDRWYEGLVRKLIKNIPRKIKENAPLSVSIIKKHNAIETVLDDYIANQVGEIEKDLGDSSSLFLLEEFKKLSALPIVKRVQKLQHLELSSVDKIRAEKILKKVTSFREDLYHIFTSKELLSKLHERSFEFITHRMIEDTFLYATKSAQLLDDDRSYLEKHGSEDKEANKDSIDREDVVLLLTLIKKKYGDLNSFNHLSRSFKHIILDEAQEAAPLELKIISEFIHEKGSITVAGDAVQQIDPSKNFTSWENVMNDLGFENIDTDALNVSYRSPKSIVEFAHHVLGPLAPDEFPVTNRQGGPVVKTLIQHRAHASIQLNNALKDLMMREPNASIAMICHSDKIATEFYEELVELGKVRLVTDADFSFKPGLDVTSVDHIRGLEFDYVIIPDADQENYPESHRSRKRLHLAATRSIHQLWVLHSRNKSVLIP